MVTTTDTQAIVTHAERRRLLELWAAVGAALLGGGLVGALVAATAIGIDVHTRPFAPYFALGALGLGLTAFIANLTRSSIDELAARIGQQAARNRNAIEAVLHDQALLSRNVTYAAASTVASQRDLAQAVTAMTKELARLRKRLDPAAPSVFDGEVQQAVTDISRVMRDRR